jgi:PASTA domain
MRRRLAHRVLGLYPREWRDRYGEELRDLSDELLRKHEFSPFQLTGSLVSSALVERVRSRQKSWRFFAITGCAALLVVGIGTYAAFGRGASHSQHHLTALTKGTVPPTQNGRIDYKKVPDYVGVVGSGGAIVGYAPKAYILPSTTANEPGNPKLGSVAPVFGTDLKTLVGHLYPGAGFVAVSASPSAACSPVGTIGISTAGTTTEHTYPCVTQVLPNVVGLFTPTALADISSLGISDHVINVHSATVPPGHIVSMSPRAGSKLFGHGPVTLINAVPNTEAATSMEGG